LGIAAIFLARGKLLIGTVVAFLQLHNEIVWPFLEMSSMWGQIIKGKVSYRRILQVMNLHAEDTADDETISDVQRIEVKNVYFSYDGNHNVLENISFTAHKGEVICLLGDNGAGKSTLLKLISGLYLPTAGSIALDGTMLTKSNMKKVRSAYGYVMQNEHVFDGTILDNLTIGRDVSQKCVEEATEQTGFASYVEVQEGGYEAKLINSSLSGGELKKLSLARLLIADRPVFVLDEPFAHLDKDGIDRLVRLIQSMRKDKIIFLVTHKKEMMQYADWTIQLKTGRCSTNDNH